MEDLWWILMGGFMLVGGFKHMFYFPYMGISSSQKEGFPVIPSSMGDLQDPFLMEVRKRTICLVM